MSASASTIRNGQHGSGVTRRSYTEYTREACPICEHRGWCVKADDGSAILCRRQPDGASMTCVDKVGATFYVHALVVEQADEAPRSKPLESPSGPLPEAAPVDVRDVVYCDMLELFGLSDHHREDLRIRGLSDEVITEGEYASLLTRKTRKVIDELITRHGPNTLLTVPGFFRDDKKGIALSSLPGLLIPVRDWRTRVVALRVRVDKVLGDGTGKYRWLSSKARGGPSSGSHVHVPIPVPGFVHGGVFRLTEGELKADIANQYWPTISVPGVGSWLLALDVLREKHCKAVHLAFDADSQTNAMVALHTGDCYRRLAAAGFKVEIEAWDWKDGKGIDDVLVKGRPISVLAGDDATAHIERLADLHTLPTKPTSKAEKTPRHHNRIDFCNGSLSTGTSSSLPQIICGSEDPSEGLKSWTPAAMEALKLHNKPPRIFQRANVLTRISSGDDEGPPTLAPLSPDALRGELDRAASWANEHFNKKGERQLAFGPPRWDVVRDIAALPSWDSDIIPRLDAIVETPRFTADGRLIQTPGYNADACIFYAPPPGLQDLNIPERPSTDEILEARSLIVDDLLGDFTFANEASRAGAVAYTLTPFVRPMIQGPTPLHHVSASTEGTGKTLLVIACAYASLGREISLSPQKEGEAEWRKAITSMLLSGATHYCLDNAYNPIGWDDSPLPFDSGTLAMALTSTHYSDRKLGVNADVKIRVQTVFASTGNNVTFSRELNRRIVPIELVATIENPSLRTGFKHDPLIEKFVHPRRRDLLRACLILIRHWICEGRKPGKEIMGAYGSYAQTLGGILNAINVPGFLTNRSGMIGRNTESTRWAAFVKFWARDHNDRAVSASDLWKTITSNSDLMVAFADIIGDKSELSQKQRLGKALERQRNHVWGEWRITTSGARGRNGSLIYRLRPSSEPYCESSDEDDDDGEDL